jgi:chemosensory pili system protein ChpA (sensor histidine kinase/response regulator)
MDCENLQLFIDEAERCLPVIRAGILVFSQGSGDTHDLAAARRHLLDLRASAHRAGSQAVESIAAEIEYSLSEAIGSDGPVIQPQAMHLLDRLSSIDTLLARLRFSEPANTADIVDFVEESFASLQSKKQPEPEEEDADEFEIDDDMIEIFALEAEDLLRGITANLETLELAPQNQEALLEIRRNSHTLKGSAGIVGFTRLSALAHAQEDLLDYLAENKVPGDAPIFELLLASTDCLSALAAGEDSAQLRRKTKRIFEGFEQTLSRLKQESREEPVAANGGASETRAETISSGNSEKAPVVRVSVDRLDHLVKLVSEMMVNGSAFVQRLSDLEGQAAELGRAINRFRELSGRLDKRSDAATADVSEARDTTSDDSRVARDFLETTADAESIREGLESLQSRFELIFDRQKQLVDETRGTLMQIRMVSFESISARLQRTVRVTAENLKKAVGLRIEGENVEVDTQILDALVEPLLHILRNAVAHGIEDADARRLLGKTETGNIIVRIHADESHFELTVTDDGRGINGARLKQKAVSTGQLAETQAKEMADEDAFDLIFLAGISTADGVDQVSGRGVGMNVVKTNIARGGGTVTVKSEPQLGTTFTIRLPYPSAATSALIVRAGDRLYAVPERGVKQVVNSPGSTACRIVSLCDVLKTPRSRHIQGPPCFLVVETSDGDSFTVSVDEVVRSEEILIKQLDSVQGASSKMLGHCVLDDGSFVPVINLAELNDKTIDGSEFVRPVISTGGSPVATIMIVDDSPSVRRMTTNVITAAGFAGFTAKDGLDALNILRSRASLPDVILTDLEMPGMDGFEFLSCVKNDEALRNIPVVLVTSRGDQLRRQKARDLGASDFFSKPYDQQAVVARMKQLTESTSAGTGGGGRRMPKPLI